MTTITFGGKATTNSPVVLLIVVRSRGPDWYASPSFTASIHDHGPAKELLDTHAVWIRGTKVLLVGLGVTALSSPGCRLVHVEDARHRRTRGVKLLG